ncbi:hypothetical protein YC2023_070833 [Brassica napus]
MREFVNPREHDKLVQEALCIYVHFLKVECTGNIQAMIQGSKLFVSTFSGKPVFGYLGELKLKLPTRESIPNNKNQTSAKFQCGHSLIFPIIIWINGFTTTF